MNPPPPDEAERLQADLGEGAATARWKVLAEVGRLVASDLSVEARLTAVVDAVVPHLGDLAVLYLRDSADEPVLAAASPRGGDGPAGRMLRLTEDYDLREHVRFGPGYVVRSGESHLMDLEQLAAEGRLDDDDRLMRELRGLGLRTTFTVPLVGRSQVLGSLSLARMSDRSWSDEDLECAEEVGRRSGLALDNAALFEGERAARALAEEASARAERAAWRMDLLSRVAMSVNAASGVEEALDGLVRVLAPEYVDVAAVWLASDALEPLDEMAVAAPPRMSADGVVMRRAVLAMDRGFDDVPTPTSDWALVPASNPIATALSSGGVQVVDLRVGLDEMASSPAAAAWVRRIDAHTVLTVPLFLKGEALGVLTLYACGERPVFGPEDERFAELLAGRASIAIERAQHDARRQRAGLTLQRSLLGGPPPPLDHLEVATRYIAGADETEVGGDWWDVIPLGAGRVAMVVGDVMGRGVRAAAVMGQLRAAVRAFSRLDPDPGRLLELMDGLVHDLDSDQMATMVYAVHDPGEGTLSVASAGHPPPFTRTDDGTVRRLPTHPGTPLGVQASTFPTERLVIEPGTVLLLYSDGLVEQRGVDLEQRLVMLQQAMVQAPDQLDPLADRLLEAMGRDRGHDDDVCLLLARVLPQSDDGADTAGLPLAGDESAVPAARAYAHAVVERWGAPPGVLQAVGIVVSELVTNAVRYARPPLELRLRHDPHTVIVEVRDGSSTQPHRDQVDDQSERGRGLDVVRHFVRRWGSRPIAYGKVVWAEIPWE